MAIESRVAQLLLIDGSATDRIQAKLDNWTGVAYKIPRTLLDLSKDREDLKYCGVYFLFGHGDTAEEDVVYIGQASERKNGESLLARCQEHVKNNKKNFFDEVIFFTTSTNDFGPTELCYIEHRFYSMAKDSGRYALVNTIEPSPGNVTEAKQAELDRYISNARILLNVLGHKVLEPKVPQPAVVPDTGSSTASIQGGIALSYDRYNEKLGRNIHADALWTSEGIVVKAGSDIVIEDGKGLPTSCARLRRQCLERKTIDKITDGVGELLEDQLFKSPSSAGCFVVGCSTNGRTRWKDKDGKTFDELDSSDSGPTAGLDI